MEDDNTKLIQKYKQDLEIYDKQLRQQIQECKTVLQHGTHIEIYDTGCEISTKRNIPLKPVLGTASFTPNKNPKYHLELALGKIDIPSQCQASVDCTSVAPFGNQEQSNTQNQSGQERPEAVGMYKLLPQTKVLEEWPSPVYIESVCPITDSQVWTTFYNTLTLLDRKGNVIQEVNHKVNLNNISLSPTTHTLLFCDTENNIMELVSGGLKLRFTTKERPMCICVTVNDHVIVGMTNNISKLTTQGQVVLTTSAVGTEEPLVCSPWRISECPITHNVAVVDMNYRDGGGNRIQQQKLHVIVMDTDFKELFVYRGDIPSTYKQSSHKIARPFNPLGMVYDSMGNISIVDYSNDIVLLISGRGEVLSTIHTDIFSTFAIGVDRKDVLWAVLGLFCGRDVKLLQYSSV